MSKKSKKHNEKHPPKKTGAIAQAVRSVPGKKLPDAKKPDLAKANRPAPMKETPAKDSIKPPTLSAASAPARSTPPTPASRPSPTTPAPVTPAPVTRLPVTPSPVTPALLTPTPVERPTASPPVVAPPVTQSAPTAAPAPTPAPAPPTRPNPLFSPELPPLLAPKEPAKAPTDQQSSAPQLPLLFEIGWEVCWQLGGIYTVLRTKAPAMLKRWGDRYCLIGPYNPATAAVEFEERPTDGIIRVVLDKLRNAGIACHFGRWLVPGRPRVILLDYRGRYGSLDHDKYLMWKDHGIAIDPADGEVNEVTAFGFTVGEFFRELTSVVTDRPILAHFHEWMAGVAVPRLAHMRLPVTTVFTTHATLLGRYLAGDNADFYDNLHFFNGEEQAAKYQILSRHKIEKAAAHASTVFTTVSEVTAREAAQLLERQPDLLVPNGLNNQRFAVLHEFQNLHQRYKERINEFVAGHFFPSYTFDLDRTVYFFTSGRYEYRNKGLDLYIEALHRVNERLRGVTDRPTIVAFVITRAGTRNINVGTLQSQAMFDELKNICGDVTVNMGRRLFQSAITGRLPTQAELLPEDATVRLKRAMHVFRTTRQPSIVTHDLHDDAGDPVLRHFRHRHLFNAADDPVKVIFHPDFLNATSPPINLDYDNFVRGCHLGVFPSYYEPWGYTPMESVALGVPAITSDLAGFGAYVQKQIDRHNEQGLWVLPRRQRSFEESVEQLTQTMLDFLQMNRRQRIELRNRVERLGEMFDWSSLVNHYHEAHDLALERAAGVRPGKLEIRLV